MLVNGLPHIPWPVAVQLVRIVIVQEVIQAKRLVAPLYFATDTAYSCGSPGFRKMRKMFFEPRGILLTQFAGVASSTTSTTLNS